LGDLGKKQRIGEIKGRPRVLLNFAIFFKAFLLLKREKSAGFLQSAYLAVILSTSENVRGVESSRLGVCARLVGQAAFRLGAVGESARFPVSTRRRVGASGTFSPSLVEDFT